MSEQLIEEGCTAWGRAVYSYCCARELSSGLGMSQLSELMEAFEIMVTGFLTGGGIQMC